MKQTTENTYEVNMTTGEVTLAQFKPGSIFISASLDSSTTTETWMLTQREGCKYFLALNKKNAIRKGKRMFQGL